MKNNFSNFIKIILIIVAIVLVIWLVFYLITKNDYSTNRPSATTPQTDENISLIENELVTIFSYINNAKESTNNACSTLGRDVGYSVTTNDNFFDYYAPIIMDCLYEKNYPETIYDTQSNYKIISDTEWHTYEDYFISLNELPSIKDIYTVDVLNNYTETELLNIDSYIDNNYKIAYQISTNSKTNSISYKINRIFKENDHYVAKITATENNLKYDADLIINIVDNHCQYDVLIFY